jgi:hypothetical protein
LHHHHRTVTVAAAPATNTTIAATNAVTDTPPAASDTGSGIGVTMVLLAAYFGPTLVAIMRKRHNTGAIFALNLFLGWTVLGWIIAFVWACTSTPTVIVQQSDGTKMQSRR